MKKLMVFGISFASCMVVFLMTIFIFKEPITNYLVSNNNLKLVGVLYGKNTLYDVVARNNYISYKKDIDGNVISGSVSSDNVSNDKYEKEILEKDDSTEGYKFINIEINGYKSYLIAIYDPSKVKVLDGLIEVILVSKLLLIFVKDIMVKYVLMVEDFKTLALVLIFQWAMLLKMVRLPGIVKVSLN